MVSPDTTAEPGDLEKLVRILFSYWRSIVLVMLVFFLLIVLMVARMPFEYKAQTTVFPSIMLRGQEDSFQAGILAGVSRQLGINFGDGASDQSILYESMLQSRKFLERILNSEFTNRDGDSVVPLEYLIPEEMAYDRRLQKAYEKFRVGNLRVNYKPETGMTTIAVISTDPVLAANICNQIVVEFELYTYELLSENSDNYAGFIDERLTDVKARLDKSEKDLNDFMKMNRVTSSPALTLQFNRLQREVMLQQQLFVSLKEQFELAHIEAEKDISKIAVLDEALTPIAKFRPRRSIYWAFGMIFGGLLGGIQALGRYYLVNNLKRVMR